MGSSAKVGEMDRTKRAEKSGKGSIAGMEIKQ
jgi:hypothetical protein